MEITRKELTSEERALIIGAYRCGTKPATIAKTFGFPPSTVYATVSRYEKSGSAQPKVRPGRPQSLSDRDQRVVKRIVLAGRRQPLGEITNEVNVGVRETEDVVSCEGKFILLTKKKFFTVTETN